MALTQAAPVPEGPGAMIDLLGMQRAVWRSARPTTEKIVLLAIADFYSDRSPEPWPSVPTLAERCSLGRTAVLEAIAALERDGVLVVRRVQGRPNRYDLSRVTPLLARKATPKVETSHDAMPEHAVARLVMETLQWDDDTNQSATQTSPADERATSPHPSASRTGPVRLTNGPRAPTRPPGERDQSAWRTGPVRLADPKDPKKDPKKEATVVHAEPGKLIPLELPIAERAKLVLEEPREAQRLQPQHWPETRRIAQAFGMAVGSDRPLSEITHDSGLRAIVVLLAAGYSVADLEWIAANVPKQAWWRRGDRVRGLGSLSVEVVSRALGERDARPRLISQARVVVSGEERRIHRNALLENAEAGRYGPEIRRAALSGPNLKGLADELEQREADGDLRLTRFAGAPNLDGLTKVVPPSAPRSQGRSA